MLNAFVKQSFLVFGLLFSIHVFAATPQELLKGTSKNTI